MKKNIGAESRGDRCALNQRKKMLPTPVLALFLLFLLSGPAVAVAASSGTSPENKETACVILLHGLARTSASMDKMARELAASGYSTVNISYPSRQKKISDLAEIAIPQGLAQCSAKKADTIHFVTHSLGGIILRYYLCHHTIDTLGRVVMLAPPNQGSEVVDNWKSVPGFSLLNGPAGLQLGTDPESVPLHLGPVTYPVGVIAGTKTINLLLSRSFPGPNDGKVSVERAKVEGMTDFIAMPVSHPFIMRNNNVILQVKEFLQSGSFRRE